LEILVAFLIASHQGTPKPPTGQKKPMMAQPDTDIEPDDPNITLPLVRYNSMLAVLRNTLYM
jgi:hypothetical protein